MRTRAFLLETGGWYGLSMIPGYADAPYHSPIRVDGIVWLGERSFELEFLNLAYAAGVQRFDQNFTILKATPDLVACELPDQPDRLYVITKLTRGWISIHFPRLAANELFDESGKPIERAFLRLI